jgi:hypothetical protein
MCTHHTDKQSVYVSSVAKTAAARGYRYFDRDSCCIYLCLVFVIATTFLCSNPQGARASSANPQGARASSANGIVAYFLERHFAMGIYTKFYCKHVFLTHKKVSMAKLSSLLGTVRKPVGVGPHTKLFSNFHH